jgi:poly-D-alanine transfer protein DltD
LPFQAAAECYQESVTVNQSHAEIREIADLQKFVKTIDKQQICTVIFRARINNKWYDGRGESQGQLTDSTDQICSQAMQAGTYSNFGTCCGHCNTVQSNFIL